MKTDLSIIIPVYNGQDCIGECLKSIEFQQGAPEFEIIVVDDGSRDNTSDVVRMHQQAFPNIKLVRQLNAGVSTARNTGIMHSHGQYITFVDADDFVGVDASSVRQYFPSERTRFSTIENMQISHASIALEKQLNIQFENRYFIKMLAAAKSDQSDVVLGGKVTLNKDRQYMKRHIYTTNAVYDATPQAKDTLLKQADCRENANFALYRSQFLTRCGLYFNSKMHLDEDMLFCMLAVLYADKVSTVSDVAYLYNRHENSLSNISNQYTSQLKYRVANIQRFSILLQELYKMPQYKEQYTHWLKYFANLGTQSHMFAEHYPSMRCAMCPDKTCDGCFIASSLPNKYTTNIQRFITDHETQR